MTLGSTFIDLSFTPDGEFPEVLSPEGVLNNKLVVEAKGQTSKGWYVLAIVIGSVVFVAAGGFGTVGLLKSYGFITLNQSFEWLSTAIGFVGNTPHFLSLWAIAAGGVVVGGGLIALGSYKIHTAGAKTDEPESVKKEESSLASFSVENLTINRVKPETFATLPQNTFSMEARTISAKGQSVEDPEAIFLVLRNEEGILLSSTPSNLTTARALGLALYQNNYQSANAQTTFNVFFSPEHTKLELSAQQLEFYTTKLNVNHYCIETIEYLDGETEEQHYIVLKAPNGQLKFSNLLNSKQLLAIEQSIPSPFKNIV